MIRCCINVAPPQVFFVEVIRITSPPLGGGGIIAFQKFETAC